MSNKLVRVVNLISIQPTKRGAPATIFATGVDSVHINFTDNINDINVDGNIYSGSKFIEISDIYDALHLNHPSYTLNVERAELKNLCKFHDLKLLEGCKIILKKYDIINKSVIFSHPGQIKSVVDKDLHIISIEVSSKLDLLKLNFCEQYSPVCRAQFCDIRCKLKINDFVYKSFITDVVNENTVIISSSVKGYYRVNIFGYRSLEITSIESDKNYCKQSLWL